MTALVSLTACDTLDLNKQQKQSAAEAAAGDLACTDLSDAVCAKSARIKARSCLELAQKAVGAAQASAPETRQNAQCAALEYTALITQTSGTAADFAGLMEAQRLTRETSTSMGAGTSANADLAQTSADFEQLFPGQAAGPYYAADSRYWEAAFSDDTAQACALLSKASAQASAAQTGAPTPDFPDFSGAAQTLSAKISRDATAKGCS
ncbi:MAG: hypothetical protein ACPGVJ_08400 [Mangrovicoccus sp.]